MAASDGEGTPTPWRNLGCMRCCTKTLPLAGGVLPPLYIDDRGFVIDDVPFAKPVVRGTLQCASGNCGDMTAKRFRGEKFAARSAGFTTSVNVSSSSIRDVFVKGNIITSSQ